MSYTLPPTRSPFSLGRILQWTICIALAALLYWALEPRPGKEVVNWRSDFTAARTEAHDKNKVIFAEFGATWCPPCQQMSRNVWSDRRVATALETFVPIKIDVDKSPQLALQFQTEFLPAFLLIDRDGRVIKRTEGAMDRSQLFAWLNYSRAF